MAIEGPGFGYALVMSGPEAEAGAAAPRDGKDPLRRSRTSSAWFAILALAGLLLVLIVFIAQNTQKVEISFLGWNGRAPLAVSLLAATLVGILLSVVAGSMRILQ